MTHFEGDIEMEATRTNSSDFLARRNDERVRLLQKGCSLDQRKGLPIQNVKYR